ncbi:HAD family hydrolase [Acetobacterium sp.]|uniref:HAD family hydrolase n=1 Tax=Acetobacterium sp. TaxID=1872094 RepID=UPI002F42B01A
MKLAIFDFDGTLVPKDSLPFVLRHWKEQRYSKIKYYRTYFSLIFLYIQYKSERNFKMSREEMRILAVKKFNQIFVGMTQEETSQFFCGCSEKIIALLVKNMVSEIEVCRSQGYYTILLSGAHHDLLKYVGEHLGFDVVFGTQLHFSNNIFDPDIEVEVISGAMKKEKILEYFHYQAIDWSFSRAYADSYSDMDLLELVGQPVAVNPDVKLKAVALDRNWRTII